MEVGPGAGYPLQGGPPGEHGRGAAGEVPGLPPPFPLRQPLPHQRVRQGARPLPRKLRQYARLTLACKQYSLYTIIYMYVYTYIVYYDVMTKKGDAPIMLTFSMSAQATKERKKISMSR